MNGRKEEVNIYGRQLTQVEIDSKVHRGFVGGMWDEIGVLQIDFLYEQGLKPCHNVFEVEAETLQGEFISRANWT